MNVQETIKNIDEYFDQILPREMVVNAISELYSERDEDGLICVTTPLVDVCNDDIRIEVSIYHYENPPSISNNIVTGLSSEANFYVPSTHLANNGLLFISGTDDSISGLSTPTHSPDTLITKAIDELDEYIFELILTCGYININSLLLLYVLYIKYRNDISMHGELLFFIEMNDDFEKVDGLIEGLKCN